MHCEIALRIKNEGRATKAISWLSIDMIYACRNVGTNEKTARGFCSAIAGLCGVRVNEPRDHAQFVWRHGIAEISPTERQAFDKATVEKGRNLPVGILRDLPSRAWRKTHCRQLSYDNAIRHDLFLERASRREEIPNLMHFHSCALVVGRN